LVTQDNPDVAAVILAVGPGDPQASYRDMPVLASVIEMVGGWGLGRPAVVVFSADTEPVLDDVDLEGCVAVIDEDGTSRASALSVGLDAIAHLLPEVTAAFVLDADVPAIPQSTVASLIARLRSSGKLAAAPVYRYVRGGPVLIGRPLWDRIIAADSDQPIEELLTAHPDWTVSVVISERAPVAVR
jgi:CTP:molybdopterin cytidylyltransferase MocA